MFRFLELLYHVHLHQPALVGEFVQVFQYSLQHLAPPRLTQCLAMLRWAPSSQYLFKKYIFLMFNNPP